MFTSLLMFCSIATKYSNDDFFFSSRRRHTRCLSDWISDVCSSDLIDPQSERSLQGLTHEAAPGPQEQVLGSLLRDGRAAARLADVVGFLQGGVDLLPIDPVMA